MINAQLAEQVRDRYKTHNSKKNGRLFFTVEYGRGETYSNRDITVYALDNYERSSVLYGRERRMWVGSFPSGATEQDARETMDAAGVMKLTDINLGGSSYVPVDQVVSHLPDDTDY